MLPTDNTGTPTSKKVIEILTILPKAGQNLLVIVLGCMKMDELEGNECCNRDLRHFWYLLASMRYGSSHSWD